MKTLNESFTNQEFESLKQSKGKLNWHDFILIRGSNFNGVVVDAYCPKCKSIVTFKADKLVGQEETKPE
jgi:hypothetical protein